ncbi:MAG: hypothetical protein WBL84_09680, partial [Xanthobacteraceae bacterium]
MSGLPWNGFGPDPATRATVGDYQGQYVAMQEMRRHWLLTEIQVNRSNAATGGLASPEYDRLYAAFLSMAQQS